MGSTEIKLTFKRHDNLNWTLHVLCDGKELLHDLGRTSFLDAARAAEIYMNFGLPAVSDVKNG